MNDLKPGNKAPIGGTYQEVKASGKLGKLIEVDSGVRLPPTTTKRATWEYAPSKPKVHRGRR